MLLQPRPLFQTESPEKYIVMLKLIQSLGCLSFMVLSCIISSHLPFFFLQDLLDFFLLTDLSIAHLTETEHTSSFLSIIVFTGLWDPQLSKQQSVTISRWPLQPRWVFIIISHGSLWSFQQYIGFDCFCVMKLVGFSSLVFGLVCVKCPLHEGDLLVSSRKWQCLRCF